MPDREKVISHLQIIHTWAEFALERDLQFFTEKHLEEIAQWTDDALKRLKEQESTMNRLRSTMEDMVRGNASEEVSYLLRLLNKWEQGEVYASDSV